MSSIDYVQPIQTCNSASTTAAIPPSPPAIIEDKDESKADNEDVIPDGVLPTYDSHWPKKPPTPPSPTIDLSLIPPPTSSVSLKALSWDELIQHLYSVKHITPPPPPPSVHGEATSRGPPSTKLECMTKDNIITVLHHPNSRLPPVRPCDTPNSSNTKTTYPPEELHRLTGCRRFRNYQHIISMTKGGALLNTGEFPLSLGTYATIPKAPHGKAIDRHQAKYLDIVHVDISFGDCVSVGGFKFTLIFVDRATRYNWTFGLKSLQHVMSAQRFWPSATKLGRSPINFDATATRSYLAAPYSHSYTSTSHPSWRARLAANPPTASLNPIGKLWYTCRERISPKSRCLGCSGIMP
jgi:hypothetical protein